MALNRKELWEKEFMKEFYPDSTFLVKAEDKSAMVDNEKIHMAEIGADPEVLLDNTVFPIPTVEYSDGHEEVILRTMSTENTVIRDIQKAARNQNLRAEAMKSHKRAMYMSHMRIAAHSYALGTKNASKGNDMVVATGSDRGDGFKAIKFVNLFEVKEVYDQFSVPSEEINFVLDLKHLADLRKEDLSIYKDLMEDITMNRVSPRFGMRFHTYADNPYYVLATDAKLAYGGTPTAAHGRASFGFVSSEVVRADGTVKMFLNEDDAKEEGDIFHFKKRFLAIPKRDKLRVALLSKSA